ncbi:unnamed protein product [Prorocentrum cordatum]|uniref:Transmembrane protein n=1 Tax=Prorocentrum cordatum TaxID=2364126 RepID=A0ABN9TWW4_9DINO|nr:unnamed protein product [Polarella glacialis]
MLAPLAGASDTQRRQYRAARTYSSQGFVASVFVLFMTFVFSSFRRLFESINSWLMKLPLWKSAVGLYHRPWARGLAVCVLLPLLPWLLALSCVNQFARRLRGLSQEPAWLTPRVRVRVEGFWSCCWVSVAPWCYIWAYVLVVYTAVPVFLYVLLAFMGEFMRSWPFPLIVVATFVTGMILFMIPPVPGPPIYLFGGTQGTAAAASWTFSRVFMLGQP